MCNQGVEIAKFDAGMCSRTSRKTWFSSVAGEVGLGTCEKLGRGETKFVLLCQNQSMRINVTIDKIEALSNGGACNA